VYRGYNIGQVKLSGNQHCTKIVVGSYNYHQRDGKLISSTFTQSVRPD